jgi:hypothetical protein
MVAAWRHFPYPGWSALLGLALATHAAVDAAWWLRRRAIPRATLALDLPVGAAALVAGAALTTRHGPVGGTAYPFPYMVLAALALGFACRTWWGTVLAGLVWAGAQAGALVLVTHRPVVASLFVVPSLLVNPVVGWCCARLLRRGSAALAAAQALAVRRTAELTTERERRRHAYALHDRVLQTMETLAAGDAVGEAALAERVAVEAAWLRRFVEGGAVDQSEDLVLALDAAARAARSTGVEIQLNDAALRADERAQQALSAEAREALLAALHQVLVALAGPAAHLVVRVTPEGGGLLVTVLSSRPGTADAAVLAAVAQRLDQAGGRLELDQVPYAELWVPAEPVVVASGT